MKDLLDLSDYIEHLETKAENDRETLILIDELKYYIEVEKAKITDLEKATHNRKLKLEALKKHLKYQSII